LDGKNGAVIEKSEMIRNMSQKLGGYVAILLNAINL
jgi:hypothetical protein